MRREAGLVVALLCACAHGCALGASDDFVIEDAIHCENERTDADEIDVDCGGADCASCASECGPDRACPTGECVAGRCTQPACDDGQKNGDESDTDCGGSCTKCEIGDTCGGSSDCQSGTCKKHICEAD